MMEKEGAFLGDQMSRIFSYWAIIYFGQFFLNNIYSTIFWTAFSMVKWSIRFDKNGLGYILGDFSTNSSGHLGAF
jgi:hypothetical protein